MIGYVTLGTNDFARAAAFYDALLEPLGVRSMAPNDRIKLWRTKGGGGMLGIAKPFDGKPAAAGNGAMVALNVGSKELVDRLHAKAIELGGADEGAPGERGPTFYGGYFRDLDGNKLVAYCTPSK
jgi:catechol 2,3-dioxygenase-like lactoylglutathione lyase family enzyme